MASSVEEGTRATSTPTARRRNTRRWIIRTSCRREGGQHQWRQVVDDGPSRFECAGSAGAARSRSSDDENLVGGAALVLTRIMSRTAMPSGTVGGFFIHRRGLGPLRQRPWRVVGHGVLTVGGSMTGAVRRKGRGPVDRTWLRRVWR